MTKKDNKLGKIKYSLTAVVPVAQYANLQPTVETEADSIEEAEKIVLPYIEDFFNKYSEKNKIGTAKNAAKLGRVLLKDFFGNEIYYDESTHEYTNSLGEVYLSGSKYASDEKPFDGDYWASESVAKHGLKDEEKYRILAMWRTNGIASSSFGTALHAAIELYGQYHDIADIIDIDLATNKRKTVPGGGEKNSAMSKLPYLQDVVRQFFDEGRLAENAQYEVLVVDHKNKRAGRIDRLITLEDGSFEVRDMKTNNKIMKKERDTYTKQLSFYADIILANGRKLGPKPIMLHHWEDNMWKDIELEKINTL
jgi:hypothetical protein